MLPLNYTRRVHCQDRHPHAVPGSRQLTEMTGRLPVSCLVHKAADHWPSDLAVLGQWSAVLCTKQLIIDPRTWQSRVNDQLACAQDSWSLTLGPGSLGSMISWLMHKTADHWSSDLVTLGPGSLGSMISWLMHKTADHWSSDLEVSGQWSAVLCTRQLIIDPRTWRSRVNDQLSRAQGSRQAVSLSSRSTVWHCMWVSIETCACLLVQCKGNVALSYLANDPF